MYIVIVFFCLGMDGCINHPHFFRRQESGWSCLRVLARMSTGICVSTPGPWLMWPPCLLGCDASFKNLHDWLNKKHPI